MATYAINDLLLERSNHVQGAESTQLDPAFTFNSTMMTRISYPILIQKVDEDQKLEYYGCYSLNVQEGIPVAVLKENALETVKAPKGLKLRVEQYWLVC